MDLNQTALAGYVLALCAVSLFSWLDKRSLKRQLREGDEAFHHLLKHTVELAKLYHPLRKDLVRAAAELLAHPENHSPEILDEAVGWSYYNQNAAVGLLHQLDTLAKTCPACARATDPENPHCEEHRVLAVSDQPTVN